MNKLLYGVAYYCEYLPYDRIDEDFRMMKEAGITVIRIAESTWSTWEPRDGEFDFSKLHLMLDKAADYGLFIIVGTPTYAIPAWLARKYPDILSDTHKGRCRYGARQNFDITHPGYRFHAERIIRKLFEEVCDCDCVIGYQLDNETKPYDTCSVYAQRLFKEWLKKKFGTTDELNRRMGLAYWSNSIADWDDLPDVRGTINGSLGAEYEAFQRHLVTEFLLWQREICEEYRRPDQFVTHNFDFEWKGYSHGQQPEVDQFDAARALTVAGCDIYHPSENFLTGAEIAFGGASAYGLKKTNYLVLETGAQGNFGWLPYPGQLRLQAFAHLASGADGVSYWHWHSIHNSLESYWKGVLSHDFSAGAVYQEVRTIGRDFSRLSKELVHLKKENRVAVMGSRRSQAGLRWFPTGGPMDRNTRTYSDYLRWLTDACYRLNVEYDIISDSERDFSGYDVLILPTLYSAPDDLISAIRAYIRKGGHVIATFRSFFSDDVLKIYPDAQPHGLTECFGTTYERFTRPVNVRLRAVGKLTNYIAGRAQATERMWGRLEAAVQESALHEPAAPAPSLHTDGIPWTDSSETASWLPQDLASEEPFGAKDGGSWPCPSLPTADCMGTASDWMELLDLQGAEPLLTYVHSAWEGIPAVTRHRCGKGEAVYLGCFFDERTLEVLLSFLFREWKLPEATPCRFPVIVRRGRNTRGERITYYLNFSGKRQAGTTHPAGTELLSGKRLAAGQVLELAPWGVAILKEER